MKRSILTLAATALLTLGLASPAIAAPPPSGPGGTTPTAGYYTNSTAKLPTCKSIGSAAAMRNSSTTFSYLGDLSNPLTGVGYGTTMAGAKTIIEDGGYSCSWLVGPKKSLTISVARISPYDRAVLTGLYLSQFGSAGTSIGGTNLYFSGYAGSTHEVGFLLEEGVYVTGKVTDDGDYFPAVLQDVSDMVYNLND